VDLAPDLQFVERSATTTESIAFTEPKAMTPIGHPPLTMPTIPTRLFVVVMIGATIACTRASSYPQGVRGEIRTEDGRSGVPCVIEIHDDPRPGSTATAVASTTVKTGETFERELNVARADKRASSLLHVSYACDGYQPRVRALEWGTMGAAFSPVADLGTVTVSR
jgi:hypothetical protein